MGATSADTQREIEEIRKDVSSAAAELRRRMSDRLSDTRAYSRQMRQNPAVLAGVAVPVVGVGALVAARAVMEARRRRRPEERLKRAFWSAAEDLSERWERARQALPLEVRVDGKDDDDRGRSARVERSDPSMVKRILWTALVAAMVAGGGLLARRLSAAVWRATMGEEPPTQSV